MSSSARDRAGVRGRVVRVDGARVVIRTADADVDFEIPPGQVQPGDLVDCNAGTAEVVASHAGEFPRPGSEVMRMPRQRLDRLRDRARALAAIRAFFDHRDFVEVETPLLVPAPGLELHLTAVEAGGGWLITSPEYQMKRLLTAGMERIYSICRCFRADEDGVHHSSEFSMLEWYRAWETLEQVLVDTEEMVASVARAVRGSELVAVEGREIDVSPPWPRKTVREAVLEFAGVDVRGDESAEQLAQKMHAGGIDVGTATHWDDLFYCAFLERVEPAIAALDRPLFLTDWPLPLAALARRKGEEPVVERFEAYIAGVELANAFGELTCADEQRRRFEAEVKDRERRGRPAYPLDERLLSALEEGMPPSAGIALGVDRLVMLVCGADSIAEIQAFASGEL